MIDTSKVIHAPVGGGRYTVTAPIVKEDYGLYLKIEGLELPQTYEVDFSNSEHNGTSVTMIGNSDGVLIPHQFIDTGKDVFAFLYHVGVDYGRTVYKFRIPNKLRPDRTDDEPTPEEQSTIDQCISALNSAVAQTAQDVIDADASAQSASDDADRAEEAKTDAQTYANNAQASATSASQSASQASTSATASAQSASQSAQIKADVEDMVDDAQASASASAQSATASANSASQASASATSASQSATSAQGYASQAQTSALSASSKATEASTSASTASAKATESAQSASQALTYKTDAESAKTASQTAQGLAESARDLAQGYAEDAQGYANDAQASAEGISASASQIAQNTADILKAFPTDTASGAVASFSDGADNIPLKSLIVNIDPVQDTSSGDPSPENICPISGWEGMNLRKANENLWDDEWYVLENVMSLITDPTDDFYGYYKGSVARWAVAQSGYDFKKLFPNGVDKLTVTADYACASSAGGFQFRVYFYYSDGTNAYNSNIEIDALGKRTVTKTSANGKKCVGFVISTNAGVTNYRGAIKNVMVTVDGATEFVEPVQNPLIPISWQTEAGTVYGAKLDVLSGVMRVEFADVDLGTLTWTYQSGYHRFNSSGIASMVKIPSSSNVNIGGLCSAYVVRSVSQVILNDNGLGVSTSGTIGIIDTRFTDPTEFKTAVDGVHYVYPLATPIEIQLSANQINSLLGANNIWADTGDTEVEYRADTKLYIEKLTQPEEDDMIADSAISEGQFFMIGNSLYRALANIASGATITVGTNAQRVSLADALNLVNA